MKTTALTMDVNPHVPSAPGSRRAERVRRPIRLRLRDAYAACLDRIPDAWLLPIRSAYVQAPVRSMRRRLAYGLLTLLRYKQPDRRLETFALADDPDVRFANVNSIIVRHLYWFGLHGWEGSEIRAWQHFCARASRVLEIGANIGFYTVCGARAAAGASYTAVEPHPHTARVLRRNLALNALPQVVIVRGAVVGRKVTDRMTLMVPAEDLDETPPGSFLSSGGEVSLAAAASYDVPAVEIADLLPGVDLLKLDVEGYEFDILSAVEDVLLRERPTLFVEILPEAKKLQRFIADLVWRGAYRIFVCGSTVCEISADELVDGRLQARYRTRDVFLVSADRPFSPGEIPIGESE